MKKLVVLSAAVGCIALSAAFSQATVREDSGTHHQAAAKGWVNLFDGKTLNGWHGFNKGMQPIANWEIKDGALVCGGGASSEDIVTDKKYGNFELEWEWKVDKGSNSGVMYHVVEDKKYHGPSETGPEYQIIDDVTYPQKLNDWQQAGADYAMHPAGANKKLKPVGEWNKSRIIFNKGHVEHWLNGEKIVAFTAWDADWTQKKGAGKWKDYPDYGNAKTGVIALQDHGNKTYYKNIRIKAL
ncbi:uncharacterized protein DUF1080 [Chitinophaga niastensis]|uniref:Uncharacterized protein DUF1080 n=1 Tax=Chitinophaga niastensis TaxID=536980 RepID=A0A2P8HQ55_CHINA|nr:DUF1080 domain-containing protein [Chitinophaga niastensis]PSL48314.1 uncharacterized protein DUF1080 [Chitinophaga niastensis]